MAQRIRPIDIMLGEQMDSSSDCEDSCSDLSSQDDDNIMYIYECSNDDDDSDDSDDDSDNNEDNDNSEGNVEESEEEDVEEDVEESDDDEKEINMELDVNHEINKYTIGIIIEKMVKMQKYYINVLENHGISELTMDLDKICNKIYDSDSSTYLILPQTKNMVKKAIKKYKNALEYTDNQTDDVCIKSIINYPESIKYIREFTPELSRRIVHYNGLLLKYIEDQTPDICMTAIKDNGCAIKYVKNQTLELCVMAIMNNIFHDDDNKHIDKKDRLKYFNDKDIVKKCAAIIK